MKPEAGCGEAWPRLLCLVCYMHGSEHPSITRLPACADALPLLLMLAALSGTTTPASSLGEQKSRSHVGSSNAGIGTCMCLQMCTCGPRHFQELLHTLTVCRCTHLRVVHDNPQCLCPDHWQPHHMQCLPHRRSAEPQRRLLCLWPWCVQQERRDCVRR